MKRGSSEKKQEKKTKEPKKLASSSSEKKTKKPPGLSKSPKVFHAKQALKKKLALVEQYKVRSVAYERFSPVPRFRHLIAWAPFN